MLGLTDKLLENKTLMLSAAAVAFFVAAILVLLLFRLAFGRRLRMSGAGRARQPRLGIVDAFDLDRHRQLVIVRRDNVEHLLMIGGPNDVLIEAEIVRAEPAREMARLRDKEPDARPALPTQASNGEPIPSVTGLPASAAPFAAPTSAPLAPSGDLSTLKVTETASAVSAQPMTAEPRLAPAPVDTRAPAISAEPPTPTGEGPTVRPPLFPLPPRRSGPFKAPPLVSSPSASASSPTSAPRIEGARPAVAEAPAGDGISEQKAAASPPPFASGPSPRANGLPPRPATFLRPPPLRPAPRPAGPPDAGRAVKEEPQLTPLPVGPLEQPAVSPAPIVQPVTQSAPPVSAADPFDSLEEEMAKLLGRGSDKG